MKLKSNKQVLTYLVGRLEGLAGTARYEIDDNCRREIKDIAQALANAAERTA